MDWISFIAGPMHPMDCTDIVVGSAQGKLTRAADMYTRDRSTPLDDTIYKGKDDLSAVFGAEVDGRTIIMFRKAVKGISFYSTVVHPIMMQASLNFSFRPI